MASSDQQDTSHHGTPPLVFDEVRWVFQIRQSLADDSAPGGGGDDDDTGIPVSVFNVPKPLQAHKPEAYTPQFIALGPYHHWRPELYEMERYKLAAARRAQKRLRDGGGVRLDALVQQLARLERKIRAHYHRYLDFAGETLAWMMLVDGAFLLEFLQVYAVADDGGGDGNGKVSSSRMMQHLVDFAGRKSAHSLILRNMIMLENQVPLFLLRRILESQCAPPGDDAGELLSRMVAGLTKELCPFKTLDSKFAAAVDVGKNAHLLEVLYYLIVPKPAADDDVGGAAAEADAAAHGSRREDGDGYDTEDQQPVDGGGDDEEQKPAAAGCEYVKQLLLTVSSLASSGLSGGRMRYVTRPIAFAVKAPWKMLTVVPGFSAMKQPVEAFFMSGSGADGSTPLKAHDGYLARPPLIEEIMIPSVSELANAGVKFVPTTGDLSTIAFDARTATFQLPAVTVDSNTEVVLRNLVAYEASAGASGPLVLARYTELMNGIIDADEDVAVLRRRGVVLNRMKSDGEVAKLWNGMARSVRLTKVAFMDAAVEEVNRFYSSRWRVKAKRFMRKYVFSSWQLLTFLAAVMMLLLTTLQAFCSVYTCSRWFGTVTVATAE